MKITANRRDDIIKQRDEYDAKLKSLKDQSEASSERWLEDVHESGKAIERKISELIGSTSLDLDIRVDNGWNKGWEVRITANERNKFDDNVALSWNWSVQLDSDGNIKKDSSSWSGLKAVTPEQIADLEESVRVIKIINNIDWNAIVKSPVPKYSDYKDDALEEEYRTTRDSRPKFEDDLIQATLEDLVGTNTAVKIKGDEYYNGPVWVLLTGLTDQYLKGYVVPDFVVSRGDASAESARSYEGNTPRRIKKTKLVMENGDVVTKELS